MLMMYYAIHKYFTLQNLKIPDFPIIINESFTLITIKMLRFDLCKFGGIKTA